MTDPWVALEPGADPAERVRVLRRAHETFAAAGTVPQPVRSVVAESWRRSARAGVGVGTEGTASVELTDGDLGVYRAQHPLARVMPLIRELMGTFAADGEHLLAVCDAQGRLLWVEGHPATRRKAGGMNFVPGARWAESAVGTNAPGTAVALDRPVQVFAAEHFIRRVQPWTCAAAPVHDPRTGRVLGAVDITGGNGLAHPHSLGFVQAVARAAESQLALLAPEQTPVDGPELTALGRDEAQLCVDGRKVKLSRRHSEILVLLARHPEGLTGDELLCALYEDESVPPVTLRAELARLRRLLGPGFARLASVPAHGAGRVRCDDRRTAAGRGCGDGSGVGVHGSVAAWFAGSGGGPAQGPASGRTPYRADRPPRPRPAGGLGARAWGGRDDLDVWRALAAIRPTAPVRSRLAALESELAAPAAWSYRAGH